VFLRQVRNILPDALPTDAGKDRGRTPPDYRASGHHLHDLLLQKRQDGAALPVQDDEVQLIPQILLPSLMGSRMLSRLAYQSPRTPSRLAPLAGKGVLVKPFLLDLLSRMPRICTRRVRPLLMEIPFRTWQSKLSPPATAAGRPP